MKLSLLPSRLMMLLLGGAEAYLCFECLICKEDEDIE